MDGFILAIIALLAWGSYPVLNRKSKVDSYASFFLSHLVATISILMIAFLTISFRLPEDFTSGVLILISIFAVMALYIFHKGLERKHITLLTTTACSMVLFSSIISWALFDVNPGLYDFISIPVIVIGIFLSSIKSFKLGKKRRISKLSRQGLYHKTALLGLITGALLGLYRAGLYITVKDIGLNKSIIYSVVLVMILLVFTLLARSLKEKLKKTKKQEWYWLLGSSAAYLIGALCFYFALFRIYLDVVLSILVILPIVTLILGAVLLKEKYRWWQYIGFILSVIGYTMIL